ncbi:MAG: excinuclease ABC subunit UvrB [Bdellovibrionota bacterium]
MQRFFDKYKTQRDFKIYSSYKPCGDQPKAIKELNDSLNDGNAYQTLLGITGSGKTFTIANVIEKQNRPALVIAPNKTLAGQLYNEFKEFFPENRVHYFVSYYDYYQPEAYIASTDTFIEKDAAINDEIDRLRHKATKALIEARDCIVVASVSCIYGAGSPKDYAKMMFFLKTNMELDRDDFLKSLVNMQYKRNDYEFKRGTFRVRGECVDVFPPDEEKLAVRTVFWGDSVEKIALIDPITGNELAKIDYYSLYPTSYFVTPKEDIDRAIITIKEELKERLKELTNEGKLLEAQRLEQRTLYDVEMLKEIGFCSGIENYSRHLDGRAQGEPPGTLLSFFPDDFLVIIDESHVTVSQLAAMYRGDRARKSNLVEYGFRLPSALDNRPLSIEEFFERVSQVIFVSATPGDKELELSSKAVFEQINRPTGLLDPSVTIKPVATQVDDLLSEIQKTIENNERVLVLTLTKKMAENLSSYLQELGIKAKYLHSDIDTLERIEILKALREGEFDVLIGINLLREGLDLVEVSLVAILDADKEGFLRSERSLIQMMGRAARNINGRVILYADTETRSIKNAVAEVKRRRKIQEAYNNKHNIIPKSARSIMIKPIAIEKEIEYPEDYGLSLDVATLKSKEETQKLLDTLKKQMFQKAQNQEFEEAIKLRDKISYLENLLLNG